MIVDIKNDSDQEIITKINDFISKWDSFENKEIQRVLGNRKFIYNTATEEENIALKGALAKAERVTLSALRPACNRIKTDTRRYQPTVNAVPQEPAIPAYVQKTFSAIADKITLTPGNMASLYKLADDILDLSIGVLRLVDDVKYNARLKSVNKSIVFEHVNDVFNIVLDASQPLERIADGDAMAYRSTFLQDNKNLKNQIEFWQKNYVTKQYGERYDALQGRLVAEEIADDKTATDYQYTYPIDEVESITYIHVVENEVVKITKWPYDIFPYLVGFGLAFESAVSDGQDRTLYLVPFADHVISAQKVIDYAATQQLYNLKSARSTTKALYPKGMIKGAAAGKWKTRNSEENDLEYELLRNPDGSYIPLKPEFIDSAKPAPAVTEVIANYPALMTAMVGVNLENDVGYNVTGETIKEMREVRSENSQLYRDAFFEFITDKLGAALEHYIPKVYNRLQYITIDNYGQSVVLAINGTTPGSINIKDMLNKFEIQFIVGETKVARKNRTYSSIKDLYGAVQGSPIQNDVVGRTIDILADSMDCPDANEIAARIKPIVPSDVLSITSGQLSLDDALKMAAQQQQQSQQQQAQGQAQQQQTEQMDVQAKMVTAKAKMVTAQNNLEIAQLRANAEVAKNV